tara:strand:+ start:1061 stop:1405 length:345 start_codon:yes stop_codon:yes gene_type:complete
MKSVNDFSVKLISVMLAAIFTTSIIAPISSKLVFAQGDARQILADRIVGQSQSLSQRVANTSKNDVTLIWPNEREPELPTIITAPRRKDLDAIDNPKQIIPDRNYNLDYLMFLP